MESINFRVQSVWVFTIVAYLWLAIVNAHADILLKFNLVLMVKFCKKKYRDNTKEALPGEVPCRLSEF